MDFKRIFKAATAVVLSAAIALSLAVSCFAINRPVDFTERFTVVWSELRDDGQVLLLSGESLGLCELILSNGEDYEVGVDTVDLPPEASYNPLPYESYDSFLKGGEIPEGTVLYVTFSELLETWPERIEGLKSIDFVYHKTSLSIGEVEEIFNELNEFNETDKFSIYKISSENFPAKGEYTVLSTDFDEKTGEYRFLFSTYTTAYSESEQRENKYFTTFATSASDKIEFSDDGTDRGKELSELYKNKKPIPAGTVCELTTANEILETYPPQIEVYAVKFTDKPTDYTAEEAISETEGINEMGYGFEVPEDTGLFADSNPEPMIFTGGKLYVLAPELGNVELPQGAEIKPTGEAKFSAGEPSEENTQNFSHDAIGFAPAEFNGYECLIAETSEGWRYFKLSGGEPPEYSPAPTEYETVPNPGYEANPKTGAAFSLIALAGVLAWCAAAFSRLEDRN